jgi:hypothetical protein
MSKVQMMLASITQDRVVAPAGHSVATASIAGSFMHWFNYFDGYYTPIISGIALTLSALWYGVTLYESATVQKVLQEWRDMRAARRAYQLGWEAYERRVRSGHEEAPAQPVVTPTTDEAFKRGFEERAKLDKP